MTSCAGTYFKKAPKGNFSENDILREEIRSLEMVRVKMQDNLNRCEEELKTVKQKLNEKEAEADEEDVPMAQRKRFTRSEMQRVLIDRNTYKVCYNNKQKYGEF